MVTTNDEEIAKKLKDLSWLGIKKYTFDRVGGKKYTWDYDIEHDGIKAYMIDLTAVIGLGNLRRLEETNERRRDIQEMYNEAFEGYDWFTAPEYSHTVQYYTPEFRDRDGLFQHLAEHGIHTSVHFKPFSLYILHNSCLTCFLLNTFYCLENRHASCIATTHVVHS